MMFIAGFAVWIAFGLIGGFVIRTFYRAPLTETRLTLVFALFGAFIGGMLGTSPYVHHDPNPLRFGSLLGAALGALAFSMIYHVAARKAV
ncbi:MAG TPA: hypothetical protein VK939_12545 [Longimicrobiales bacterium]|nr:hypothetical protein [Longimicrobiales bacterium]